MAQYVIGVDFGSLSGRAVLVDSRTGQIAAQRTVPYAHGVMTEGGAGGRCIIRRTIWTYWKRRCRRC